MAPLSTRLTRAAQDLAPTTIAATPKSNSSKFSPDSALVLQSMIRFRPTILHAQISSTHQSEPRSRCKASQLNVSPHPMLGENASDTRPTSSSATQELRIVSSCSRAPPRADDDLFGKDLHIAQASAFRVHAQDAYNFQLQFLGGNPITGFFFFFFFFFFFSMSRLDLLNRNNVYVSSFVNT